jgi:hypothetical protein
MLKDCVNVNSWEHSDSAQFTKGDTVDVYFVLIDASLDTASESFLPPGRRYIPETGAALQVVIENINDAKKITRSATQPFVGDGSIWKVQFFSTDVIEGTANLRLTLTEGPKTTKGLLRNAFRIYSDNNC